MTLELLIENVNNKYGQFVPQRLTGGYTNQTFLLEGTTPLLVAKIANLNNIDSENEINCMKLMQESSHVPKIYESFQLGTKLITIMEYRKGENAQAILDKPDLEMTKEIYKLLGETLAIHIHSNKYINPSEGIRESNFSEINLELPFVPQNLILLSKKWLSGVLDSKNHWVLTHGDYGVHNVLFDSTNSITVLDWEWSEWGNPLTDIAWVCWFTGFHYPTRANELIPIFIDTYKNYNSIRLTANLLKGYSLYQVWKVLHKVKNASTEAQEEWVKRLKWTLETNIFEELLLLINE